MLEDKTKNSSTLFVDLDNSLITTDTLWESTLILLKSNPLMIIYLFIWLLKGKAHFKDQLAQKCFPNPATLPYRREVLNYLRNARASGRPVILATAAHRRIAKGVADHLGIFSGILATNADCNLSGSLKLEAIQKSIGEQPFDYIGDSPVDLPVWEAATIAIIIEPSDSLLKRVSQVSNVELIPTQQRKPFIHT